MSDQTHPDSPSGQPYSAPRKARGGNADPRNLSYEPEGQSYLPPPFPPSPDMEAGRTLADGTKQNHIPGQGWVDAPPSPYFKTGGSDSGGGKHSWFARHKVLTGLLAVVALFLVVGIIGAVTT